MTDPRALPSVVLVTGTGTGVGKTVVTAALAVLVRARGSTVAVVKPAQTGVGPGDPGDVDEVRRLAGDDVAVHELVRLRDPLSPEAAARRAMSLARFQFTAPSCGCIIACIWPMSAEKSGIPAPPPAPNAPAPPRAPPPPKAAKSCSKGVPLKGLGWSPGSFVMAPKLLGRSQPVGRSPLSSAA